MLFDVKAALAEILDWPQARCDFCDTCDSAELKSRGSRESQLYSAANSAPIELHMSAALKDAGSCASPPTPPSGSPPNELLPSAEDYRRTWTGRVVSMDEWRQLSVWDQHGPAGRLFCGICKAWVSRDGDCSQTGCCKGQGL